MEYILHIALQKLGMNLDFYSHQWYIWLLISQKHELCTIFAF